VNKQKKQAGSKTESRDAAALPSPEALALIAATIANGGSEKPATAIAYAARLYEAACEHLEWKIRYRAVRERETEAMNRIPQPDKFPAPFKDFLRLIVRGKTPADRTKRFRDYLRDQVKQECGGGKIEDYPKWAEWAAKKHLEETTPEELRDPKWAKMTKQQISEAMIDAVIEKSVADQLADWQRYGLMNQDSWFRLAKQYACWWAGRRSDQARAAGKKSRKSS
jgi:hypothetical protein